MSDKDLQTFKAAWKNISGESFKSTLSKKHYLTNKYFILLHSTSGEHAWKY